MLALIIRAIVYGDSVVAQRYVQAAVSKIRLFYPDGIWIDDFSQNFKNLHLAYSFDLHAERQLLKLCVDTFSRVIITELINFNFDLTTLKSYQKMIIFISTHF